MRYLIKICHLELWGELMLDFVKSHGIWTEKEKIVRVLDQGRNNEGLMLNL